MKKLYIFRSLPYKTKIGKAPQKSWASITTAALMMVTSLSGVMHSCSSEDEVDNPIEEVDEYVEDTDPYDESNFDKVYDPDNDVFTLDEQNHPEVTDYSNILIKDNGVANSFALMLDCDAGEPKKVTVPLQEGGCSEVKIIGSNYTVVIGQIEKQEEPELLTYVDMKSAKLVTEDGKTRLELKLENGSLHDNITVIIPFEGDNLSEEQVQERLKHTDQGLRDIELPDAKDIERDI